MPKKVKLVVIDSGQIFHSPVANNVSLGKLIRVNKIMAKKELIHRAMWKRYFSNILFSF